MQPVNDVDALLLLATALCAKRRPADLVGIVAAVDLIQGNIPNEAKLLESLQRLTAHRVIEASAAGFALSAAAQQLVEGQPKNAEANERVFIVREKLSAFATSPTQDVLALTEPEITAAIRAHRAAGQGTAKNLLMPKPKPAETSKSRPGQRQRKPMPKSRPKR
jgi:hypothetical protein